MNAPLLAADIVKLADAESVRTTRRGIERRLDPLSRKRGAGIRVCIRSPESHILAAP
jgi:hypothetical protein